MASSFLPPLPPLHCSAVRERIGLSVVQSVSNNEYDTSKVPEYTSLFVGKAEGILIGVTASRATFPTRVAEIMKTWASDLPKGVHVRFYVGDPVDDSALPTGSQGDIAHLAWQANISDTSTIVVMKGIKDDEYPLVHKATAVLDYMDKAMHSLKSPSGDNIVHWAFDVDDDTYINMEALQEFLFKRNFRQHMYIGQQGWGDWKDAEMLRKGGLTKAYCMGGTGILMTKDTLRVLVKQMNECIHEARKTMKILYDDVLMGVCLQRHIGLGCWTEDPTYNENTFAHNYASSDSFPNAADLWKTVTLHPHKTPGMMSRTHERFKRFGAWSFSH